MSIMSDENALNPVERLLAIEDIRNLKARYFRLVDQKRFEEFADVFTEDFRFLDDAKDLIIEGRARFVEFISDRHRESVSIHAGHSPEIEILDDRTAHGIWGMSDLVILPSTRNGRTIQRGAGHYEEHYRRGDDGWRIAQTHLTRLWLRIEHQEQDFTSIG